jgi:hypothetical protein
VGERRDSSSLAEAERSETDGLSTDRLEFSFCFMLSTFRSAGDWNLNLLCCKPKPVGSES